MPKFNPDQPFPLLSFDDYTYQQAKDHALCVDQWLGLRLEEKEVLISENSRYQSDDSEHGFLPEFWRGLPIQSLQTPYLEIGTLLSQLDPQPGERVVDLGAAYGRMGFVVGYNFPEVKFVGYEYVQERVLEARRSFGHKNLTNSFMLQSDLSDPAFTPQPAEYYFMYDFGSRHAIDKTLHDLGEISKTQDITVVGRGYNTRKLIERDHPWLCQLHTPVHYPGYSLYYAGSWAK